MKNLFKNKTISLVVVLFLLWLLIDVLGILTVISGTVVVGGTFILQHTPFKWSKIV